MLLSWPDPERRDRFKRKAAGEVAPPELERQVRHLFCTSGCNMCSL